ncbi:MAG TPA: Lrp/AsnC family transcriptional regulator [Thermoplasmata archaeon]|jgi:DNA-binding Lrp family transcriptional regulator
MPNQANIDEIDVRIIRALQKDARTSFSDIAEDCGVSIDTISKRFKRMKRNGVARGTTVLLNPKSFGYDCVSSFGIRVDHLHVEEVVDFVEGLPEVIFCTPSMGRHNIFAVAVLKDVGRLEQVKEHIKRHPKVREAMASIWVDEIRLCPENFEFKHVRKK